MSDIKKQIKDFNLLTNLLGTDNILLQRESGTSFRTNIIDLFNYAKIKDYSTAGLAYQNSLNYQTIQVTAESAPTRPKLNFSSQFLFIDNSGNNSTDIGINSIGWNKISGTPSTLEGYGINTINIDISDLITLIDHNTLSPLTYYNITNSQYGGNILLYASTNHQIDANGKWFIESNLSSFGSITFNNTGSGTDSVIEILVGGSNILSSPIPFNTTIDNTISNIAININNGDSGFTAVNINTSLLIISNIPTFSG